MAGALRLTSEALPLVVSVRLALWRERFPAFYARWNAQTERELNQAAGSSPAQPQPAPPQPEGEPDAHTRRLVWECSHAVSRAARLVPRASCLTQALVLQRLLARRGQKCALFLGVDRPGLKVASAARSGRDFEAHAWIEWHGRVLIGGDISRWTPFPLHPASAPKATPKARSLR